MTIEIKPVDGKSFAFSHGDAQFEATSSPSLLGALMFAFDTEHNAPFKTPADGMTAWLAVQWARLLSYNVDGEKPLCQKTMLAMVGQAKALAKTPEAGNEFWLRFTARYYSALAREAKVRVAEGSVQCRPRLSRQEA